MISDITNNKELENLVDSQIRLYKEIIPKFWYENDEWCYYMLNKLTMNSPHYTIFEIRLFDALYEVTKDEFFEDEATRRRNLMTNYHKIYFFNKDVDTKYIFLRGNAPHYYLDIFDTELVFFNSNNEIIKKDFCSGGREKFSLETCFMNKDFPKETAYVEWNIITTYYTVKMGKVHMEEIKENSMVLRLKENYIASGSGKINKNKELVLRKSIDDDRCNLENHLENLEFKSTDIFALEVDNMSGEIFLENMVIYDKYRQAVSRYLQQIKPGKNLITFGKPGFYNQNRYIIDEINFFNLRIYTYDMKNESALLKIGNMYKFSNAYEYYQYLNSSDYKINWGEG